MGSTGKKNSSTLEENELNYLLEKFSKDHSETDLSDLSEQRQAARCPQEYGEEARAEESREAR